MLFQLQDLELALEQPQIKCLDLATHFVGRKHSHGPVSIVESLSLGKKHQLAHLDLGYDQRLDGVDCKFNYTVKEIDCPDGAIKSFHPFMLQIKGVGQFVLFTKLLLELKKQILHYLMPGGTWAVTEYMDHNDQNRRKWGLDLKGTPIILCVSKSLRRTLVDCGLYRQAFGSTSSTNGVYYSTHNDGLRIDSTLLQAAVGYYPMILIPCLTLSDMVFPTFEHSIRYLELNANSFTRGLQWFKKIVYQLNNLQELFILATEVDLEVFPGSGRVMIVNVRLQEHDYPGTKLYDGAYIPPLMQIDEQMGNRFRDVVQDIGLYPSMYYDRQKRHTEHGDQALDSMNLLPTDFKIEYCAGVWYGIGELYRDRPKTMEYKWPIYTHYRVTFIPPGVVGMDGHMPPRNTGHVPEAGPAPDFSRFALPSGPIVQSPPALRASRG